MLTNFRTALFEKTQLNSETYIYRFNLLEPQEINFRPGQYIMLKVPTDRGHIARLYSIASSSLEKNIFSLIIQTIPGGLASTYISSFKINDEIMFQGPGGLFGMKDNEIEKIFMVTGTGIAPIRSMLISNILNKNFHLFWGLKTYKDVYLFDELKQFNPNICLSREKNLDSIPETERKYFDLGHVDICYEKKFKNFTMEQWNNFRFYLCGAREVVESLRLFLLSNSVPKANIYFEKF